MGVSVEWAVTYVRTENDGALVNFSCRTICHRIIMYILLSNGSIFETYVSKCLISCSFQELMEMFLILIR
jgi:hypothetical protein